MNNELIKVLKDKELLELIEECPGHRPEEKLPKFINKYFGVGDPGRLVSTYVSGLLINLLWESNKRYSKLIKD